MKKQVLITVLVAIFAFVIGYRADKTYDLKRDDVQSNNTSSSVEADISSSSKQETTKPSSSSQSSSSSKVELTPELEQRFGATFRNTKWGDSKETVKKYESNELKYEEKDSIAGDISLYGDEYNLVYMFQDDKLYLAGYMLSESYLSSEQYIGIYNKLKEKLIEIYGEPIEDKIYKYDDLYADDPGDALHFGHAAYHAEWNTSSTKIELQMQAKNFKESLILRYTDINYKDNPKDSGL